MNIISKYNKEYRKHREEFILRRFSELKRNKDLKVYDILEIIDLELESKGFYRVQLDSLQSFISSRRV